MAVKATEWYGYSQATTVQRTTQIFTFSSGYPGARTFSPRASRRARSRGSADPVYLIKKTTKGGYSKEKSPRYRELWLSGTSSTFSGFLFPLFYLTRSWRHI